MSLETPPMGGVPPLPPSSRNSVWVLVATLIASLLLLAAGIALSIGVYMGIAGGPTSDAHPIVGQGAVLAVVLGGGGACVALGGLLFGWLGGSPYVPVGSHRSVIGTTVLALVIGGLMGVGYLRLAGSTGEDQANILSVLAVTFYGTLLLMVYLQGIRPGLLTKDTLGLRPEQIGPGIAGGIAAAIVLLILAAVNGVVLNALGIEQPQQDSLKWLQGRPAVEYAVAITAVAVLAPAVEELFFRGYVFNAYLQAKGIRASYIFSSLAFSLVHGLPALLLAIFGTGLVLAYTYRRTGTIVAPIVAHVLNNSIAFIALVAGQSR